MSNRRIRAAKKEAAFSIRAGARIAGGDPQQIGEELERLYRQHGKLDGDIYVKEAEQKASPLHSTLEWDNQKAGHEHRLYQARNIIRSVIVVVDDKPSAPVYVRVDREQGYHPTKIVVENVDMFTAALTSLQRKLNEAQRAVEELKAAAEQAPEQDADRMARIALAVQALQTADRAVSAIH